MSIYKKVILSQERISGKIAKILGGILGISMVLMIVADLYNTGGVKLIGLYLIFILGACMFYFMGAYQDRKYKMLGRTPLELNSNYCKKNHVTKATITINRKNFNKVNEIRLSCLQSQGDSSVINIVWKTTIEPKIHFVNDITLIEFDINIPKRLPESTSGLSAFFPRGKCSYEASFKFTESMEFVERTWKIPVKAI